MRVLVPGRGILVVPIKLEDPIDAALDSIAAASGACRQGMVLHGHGTTLDPAAWPSLASAGIGRSDLLAVGLCFFD